MNNNTAPSPEFLPRDDGHQIAYHRLAGQSPGVIFCGGFMSDMTGTKAQTLEAHCAAQGRAFVRFDYLGHGQSSGKFADGTIGRWQEDSLAVFDELTEGPQVVVGSSMGGWISLLLALQRPERIQGLLLLAPAPDFTEQMFNQEFNDAERAQLKKHGRVLRPTDYGDQPYTITQNLINEARQQLLLTRDQIEVSCPVDIVHGMQDTDVAWQRSLLLTEKLRSQRVALHYIKQGDHRLSEPEDLKRLCHLVEGLWHPYPEEQH
ncbi:MAG: alpha/beta hydrolase [Immundisolibacteraceae bacterium]|nr:alpha/beta hydrolase [Immundisolibacteraceae bacterium]